MKLYAMKYNDKNFKKIDFTFIYEHRVKPPQFYKE